MYYVHAGDDMGAPSCLPGAQPTSPVPVPQAGAKTSVLELMIIHQVLLILNLLILTIDWKAPFIKQPYLP